MKIAFVCWRPYQLMNMINYIEEFIYKKEITRKQLDLYLTDPVMHDNIDFNFLETHYFNNIFKYYDKNINSVINRAYKYLFAKYEIMHNITPVLSLLPRYDILVATGYDNMFVRICNINKDAKIIILEDGMATYANDEMKSIERLSKYNRILKHFGLGPLSIHVNTGYSYNPELIQYIPKYNIEKFSSPSEKTIQNCKKIFGFSENDLCEKHKMIYLTATDSFKTSYGMEEEDFFKKIFGKDTSVLIRLHPKKSGWRLKNQIDEKNEMWELQCNSLSQENILVSVFSTAMVTPFMLYKKSCKLVFLYKLLYKKEDSLFIYAESFLGKFKEIYPDEIYIPETYDEARKIIKSLSKIS